MRISVLSKKLAKNKLGQTAIEYMLLLAVVVAIILVAIPFYLPKLQESTGLYFNRAANGIMGEPPP